MPLFLKKLSEAPQQAQAAMAAALQPPWGRMAVALGLAVVFLAGIRLILGGTVPPTEAGIKISPPTPVEQPAPVVETPPVPIVPGASTEAVEQALAQAAARNVDGAMYLLDARIQSSIYNTMYVNLPDRVQLGEKEAKKFAQRLSAHVNRVAMWWFDNLRTDLRAEDHIRVLYQRDDSKDGLWVHAIVYEVNKHAQSNKAKRARPVKTYAAFWHKPADEPFGRYYDQHGQEIEMRLKNSPIDSWEQITELVKTRNGSHQGMDFKAPVGVPVKAPFAGRVTAVNWRWAANGNCVKIEIPGQNMEILFLHLSKIDPAIKEGVMVQAGQLIGAVGNTGRSSAAHLHYQINDSRGKALDPMKVHGTERRGLGDAQAIMFVNHRNRLQALLDRAEGTENLVAKPIVGDEATAMGAAATAVAAPKSDAPKATGGAAGGTAPTKTSVPVDSTKVGNNKAAAKDSTKTHSAVKNSANAKAKNAAKNSAKATKGTAKATKGTAKTTKGTAKTGKANSTTAKDSAKPTKIRRSPEHAPGKNDSLRRDGMAGPVKGAPAKVRPAKQPVPKAAPKRTGAGAT